MAPFNSVTVNSRRNIDLLGSKDSVVEVGWRQDTGDDDDEGDDDDDDSPLTFYDEKRKGLLEFTTCSVEHEFVDNMSPNLKTRSLQRTTTTRSACGKNKEEKEELRKQLIQMQIKLEQMEVNKNQQTKRANELEQLLNGYESNDPKEVILTKELELADAYMKIDLLQKQVTKLQQQQNKNDRGGGGEDDERQQRRRRQFGGLTSSFRHQREEPTNNDETRNNNDMTMKHKSLKNFRWSPRNDKCASTSSATHIDVDESNVDKNDNDDNMLKSLLCQLRQKEKENCILEKKCQSQLDTIQGLRNKFLRKNKDKDTDDNGGDGSRKTSRHNHHNHKLMLNHSLHQKIMQTQVSALEEERNEFAKKCQLQERIIRGLKQQQKVEAEKAAIEAETAAFINQQQQQQQHISTDDDDPRMKMEVSLHRSILQTQIDGLEEERTHYKKNCLKKDNYITSLKDENNLLKLKIDMLEQMMVAGTQSK